MIDNAITFDAAVNRYREELLLFESALGPSLTGQMLRAIRTGAVRLEGIQIVSEGPERGASGATIKLDPAKPQTIVPILASVYLSFRTGLITRYVFVAVESGSQTVARDGKALMARFEAIEDWLLQQLPPDTDDFYATIQDGVGCPVYSAQQHSYARRSRDLSS